MQILPSHPMSQYIQAVELNGEAINATFVDMETGRVQYWNAGEQVEGVGQVRILLESKSKALTLDPAMAVELDALLEKTKQQLACMSPEDRARVYEEQKQSLARALSTPCKHGELDFEQCDQCRMGDV